MPKNSDSCIPITEGEEFKQLTLQDYVRHMKSYPNRRKKKNLQSRICVSYKLRTILRLCL